MTARGWWAIAGVAAGTAGIAIMYLSTVVLAYLST